MQPVRRLFLVSCVVVALCCSNAGAEGVTLDVFYRVLMIRTRSGQGTGFTMDVEGRQYLITARHMVTGLQAEDTIQIRKYDASGHLQWVPFRMKIYKCDEPVDIAVLIPSEQLTFSTPMDPKLDGGPVFGQDVVGFPGGRFTDVAAGATFQSNSPFGYVKRAVVSGISSVKIGGVTKTQYVLDGLNIGGFSGSPIVYRPNGGNLQVVAVICGFTPDYGPVLTTKEIRREEATPEDYGKARIIEKDGHIYRLEEPKEMPDERYVILNSGIANAWDIRHAVELIHLHANGPKVVADFKPSLAR
jgi:hypothetical protein